MRTFTLDEANRLVPRIASALARTTQLLGHARLIARQLAEEGVSGDERGGLPDEAGVDDPELAFEIARARLLITAAKEEAGRLEALGVIVHDLERGLVDFRSVLDGERDVFLCWQLGEHAITSFHDPAAGFAGRQPVAGHSFFSSRQLVPPRSSE